MSSKGSPKKESKATLSKGILFQSVILIAVFAMAARIPLDTDLWWHLRAGETTWETGQPLLKDLFSFTRFGEEWVNHSWLGQVFLYLVYRAGELRAISAFVASLAVLSIGINLMQLEGGYLIKAITLLLVSLVSSVVWSPRPQTISLVLFAVIGYLLYLFKWKGMNRLGWCIPLFMIWSNTHGGYVLGIILMGTMIAGEIFNILVEKNQKNCLSWHEIGQLGLWMFAAWLVVVVNPNGLDMWRIPFQTVGVETLQKFIEEWSSPNFHQFVQQPFIWLALAAFASVGVSKREIDGSDLIPFSVFFYAALVARRNYGPFALVAGPILSRYAADFHSGFQKRAKERWRWYRRLQNYRKKSAAQLKRRVQVVLNVIIIGLALLGTLSKWIYITSPEYIQRAERDLYPVKAVEWMKGHHPEGNLFNDYNWGGYLIWNLREYPVFVDGRTDLFAGKTLHQYLEIMQCGERFNPLLENEDIRILFVPTDFTSCKYLSKGGWALRYQDQKASIYTR